MNIIIIILALVAICCFGTFWALIDIYQKDFDPEEMKPLWIFISAIPFLGFIIYFAFGVKKGKKPEA